MTFGGWGLLVYVIWEQRRRVIVLDLAWAQWPTAARSSARRPQMILVESPDARAAGG